MIQAHAATAERDPRHHRLRSDFLVWQLATAGVLCAAAGGVATGCRNAPSPIEPVHTGPDTLAPVLQYAPSRDTLVDSVGVLTISVAAHAGSLIDSVALLLTGAPFAFLPVYPQDTTALVSWTLTLASLSHRPFGFQIVAGDILGHSTTTGSVRVTPR